MLGTTPFSTENVIRAINNNLLVVVKCSYNAIYTLNNVHREIQRDRSDEIIVNTLVKLVVSVRSS
jgi:hypothetical protein